MFLDAHVHLDRYEHPARVLAAADAAGVVCVAMTETPEHFDGWAPLLACDPRARLALGAHPLRATELDAAALRRFDGLVDEVEYVGEVGLDGSREGRATLREQRIVFDRVLARVTAEDAILSVHSRGAEADTIAALADARVRAVLHWYSGALRHVDDALDAGLYFSVNAAMLGTQKGARLLRSLPPERVLTETDGPFVTVRGRRAQPSDIPALVDDLADLWGCSGEDARAQIEQNLDALVRGARVPPALVEPRALRLAV